MHLQQPAIATTPTLHVRVVYDEHEAPAQRGGSRFRSSLDHVQDADLQGLDVEASLWVLLHL